MESPIKCVILKCGTVLISEISLYKSEEDDLSDLIEWQLTKPFEIKKDLSLQPWLIDYTDKVTFKIYSDSIITITDPNKEHLKK